MEATFYYSSHESSHEEDRKTIPKNRQHTTDTKEETTIMKIKSQIKELKKKEDDRRGQDEK